MSGRNQWCGILERVGKFLGGGGNFGYSFSFLFHLLSRGYKVPKVSGNCKL